MNKKIALCAPPRDDSGFRSYQGIFPPEVLKEFTGLLRAAPGIDFIGQIDLRQAYTQNGHAYIGKQCLSDLDMLFWFYILPLGNQEFDLQLLKTIASHTRVLPSPHGVGNGLDKFTTHTLLKAASIDTPEFCLFRSDKVGDILHLLDSWGEMLLKPRLGSFGHGVTKISTRQALLDTVQYAASFARDPLSIFCERFEPHDMQRWISVTVINGKVAYGYRKRASRIVEGWKVYDADMKGGEADYADPDPVADIALKAAKALGADLIGFDFIYSTRLGKYLIVDANTVPGLYPDCFAKSGKSWAEYFADMVLSALKG